MEDLENENNKTCNNDENDKIEKILKEEREIYINTEIALRRVVKKNIRSLPLEPSESEISAHLKACREYYEKYKKTDGNLSPFINSYNNYY